MSMHALSLGALLAAGCAPTGSQPPSTDGPEASSGLASSSSTTTADDVASSDDTAGTDVSTGTTMAAATSSSRADESGSDGTASGATASDSEERRGCVDSARWSIAAGSPIEVDGIVADGEWDDATPFAIEAGADWTVPVGIKHDGEALLLVYASFQPPAAPPFAVFPELMVDVGLDAGDALERDDFWFHVSATDCSATGALDEYEGCVPDARDWDANNFPQGSLIDLVEIRIPLQTLGLDLAAPRDVGLLLRLSDTQGFATQWPDDGDAEVPATWAAVRLCPAQ